MPTTAVLACTVTAWGAALLWSCGCPCCRYAVVVRGYAVVVLQVCCGCAVVVRLPGLQVCGVCMFLCVHLCTCKMCMCSNCWVRKCEDLSV